jgi:D-alanyl-D-alanine carboxypeptidase
MFDDMREQGLHPFVREGFRTKEYQIEMMRTRISEYTAQGYSEEEAESMARDYVAEPGTSEHELGLAVDINADGGEDPWGVYSWLAENAYQYGFILRYPEGKTEITGIAYEPWHYRYVGTEAAAEIHEQGITLEEYLRES